MITIGIYIGLTRFFKVGAPEVMFDTNKKISKMLVIVKKIYAKLILSRYIGLNFSDYCKLKAPYIVNHKHNMTKTEKVNPKAKAKQLKNKKQKEKRIEKKRKFSNKQFSILKISYNPIVLSFLLFVLFVLVLLLFLVLFLLLVLVFSLFILALPFFLFFLDLFFLLALIFLDSNCLQLSFPIVLFAYNLYSAIAPLLTL